MAEDPSLSRHAEGAIAADAEARKIAADYTRVGIDYFKVIERTDRHGSTWKELKKWNKAEIKEDHGKEVLNVLSKYDDFILVPNNNGAHPVINNCYNMYHPVPHVPAKGELEWTDVMLEQIFGDQMVYGLIYLQVLYLYPKQALPVLALVSQTRQTGKSTFLDWLGAIYGQNMVMIDPEVIGSPFNAEYATANIIGIDETIIERKTAVEKIKALATKKRISVNMKFVHPFQLPFYGKIIMASNNERDFMRIDQEEIRFWVRKLPEPKIINHNILNDCIKEIPAFLHMLKELPVPDFSKSRMVLTPGEIKNEWLDDVKEESKPNLYYDLKERFTNYFDEVQQNILVIARTADIKDMWYGHNNNVSMNWISAVLKKYFEARRSKGNYISALESLTQRGEYGRGWIITKEMIGYGDDDEDEVDNN